MQLQQLINQLQNDDKIIVVNETHDPLAVIMTYTAYDQLKSGADQSLTSERLLARINSDISQWNELDRNPISLDDEFFVKNNSDVEIDEEDPNIYLETIDE